MAVAEQKVQAAHIRPVSDKGPDSVRNGVALSATVHWMFDRGLVGIGPPPTYEIRFADGLPENALGMINSDRRLRVPEIERIHPAPAFLDHHRQHVFKG